MRYHRVLLTTCAILYAVSLVLVPAVGAAMGMGLFSLPLLGVLVGFAFGGPHVAMDAFVVSLPMLMVGTVIALIAIGLFIVANLCAIVAVARGGHASQSGVGHVALLVSWGFLSLLALVTGAFSPSSAMWIVSTGGIWLACEIHRRAQRGAMPAVIDAAIDV